MNNKILLSRAECSALRGIAIIGIVLHNYCHWLDPIVKENEYTWSRYNVDWFNQVTKNPDWNLPVHLLSFFGHYGVPVFFFLSAYGLILKYENGDETRHAQPLRFIRYHYLKLFKMMIVGFVAFTMIDAITPGSFTYDVMGIISQLLMFNNMLPTPDKVIWPGPYWFFGVMLQLYIVYRLLLYRRHWIYIVGMIVVCWLMQVFCYPESETLNRIRYNFMGGILPFGAGLLYARYAKVLTRPVYAVITMLSAAFVYWFSYNYMLWFWVPLFACTFCIGLVKIFPLSRLSSLEWLGSLSAALFVCHPITRKIFIPISRRGDIYTGLLLYIIASIAIAWLFRELLRRIPTPKLK